MINHQPLPRSIPCPCGSGKLMGECCAPYLQGQGYPTTAEQLMRSRYTAYGLKQIDYLIKTHHPHHRSRDLHQSISVTAESVKWLGLRIMRTQAGGQGDQTGIVEFVAVYQEASQLGQLHERSHFSKEQGQWFYVEGDLLPPLMPKRNEPCWCHSGKKFKQCHGKKS